MLQHYEERRQDEKGFTLIELMVVVLIMGILMAIAIPTFLSTRGSANDAAAKSNATNVFTNEKAYYASNIQFLAATAGDSGGNTLDDSLPWGTGAGQVQGVVGTADSGATDNSLLVSAQSANNNCFYIVDVEDASAAYIGYAWTTGAAAGACSASALTTHPTITSGAQSGSQTAGGTLTWYQSW